MLYRNLHQWKVEGKRCTYNVKLCKLIIFLSISFFGWVTKIWIWTYRLRYSWKLKLNLNSKQHYHNIITLLVLISWTTWIPIRCVGTVTRDLTNVKMWKMISVTFIKGLRFPKKIVNSSLKFSTDNLSLLPVTSYLKSSMSFTIDNILWHALIPLDNKQKLS